MSLRLRLVMLTVALVSVVALTFSFLYMESLVGSLTSEAIDRSDFASQQVNAFLIEHINQHLVDYPAQSLTEDTRALWNLIVETDRDISSMLEKMMAASRSILEINVAGQDGNILISSNPTRPGTPLKHLQPIAALNKGALYERVLNLVNRGPDFESTLPIGSTPAGGAEPAQPVFTIQVVTSSVLLRANLLPPLQRLGIVSAGALLAAILITVILTTGTLRPLRRIEQTIDRIAQGSFRADDALKLSPTGAAREFRVMESKLNLLGQQFRGAREDATELRQNVDQLLERMASQLDVATRLTAISKLTGGVAHEIKNPLNAIVLRLDLLRERLGGPEEELRQEIDILSREALRLDRVVKTFLDFSRPVEVNLETVDLASLSHEVVELMLPQAKAAGIEMTFEGPAEPVLMRGDPDMLKQVLLNLASNGLEAMQGKPNGRLHVKVWGERERVHLTVSDTGPGISPALRAKVFQLYFTTKTRGTGIGLAMTYRAAQLHNGTIDFTSEEGQGTQFHVEFPAIVRHV